MQSTRELNSDLEQLIKAPHKRHQPVKLSSEQTIKIATFIQKEQKKKRKYERIEQTPHSKNQRIAPQHTSHIIQDLKSKHEGGREYA